MMDAVAAKQILLQIEENPIRDADIHAGWDEQTVKELAQEVVRLAKHVEGLERRIKKLVSR